MELPNIGQQCAQTDCKQLDFLPLQCKCSKQFCSNHFNQHIKSCETLQRLEAEPQKIDSLFKCSEEDCDQTSLVPLICHRCQKHFCIKHRHLTECKKKDEKQIAEEKEKIAAPIRQFQEAKVAVDKQLEQSLTEAKKKNKTKNLANKVQLMKIKNKAKGLKSIPTSDRVYFNVTYRGTENQDTPVFVSKQWSLGRAIDAIADECRLKNDNNKSSAKKLRLFKKDTGEIISKDPAEHIHTLLGNSVIDGENLVIEYVNDGCHSLQEK